MLDSVRSRLALWHTLVLAVLLVGFAAVSYLWLDSTVRRRDDRFLEEAATAFRTSVEAERAEVPLDTAIAQSLEEFHLRNISFLPFDATGRAISRRTQARLDTSAVRRVIAASRAEGVARLVTVGTDDDQQRLFIQQVTLGGERYTLVAAASLADQLELMEDTRASLLVTIPVVLVLAWLGGYTVARRSLAPVAAMSRRASEIGSTSLHERLPVGNPRDELGQLAASFNSLLGRVDAAFQQQQRFMADASHELRTPVSILRGEADIALSQAARTPEEYRGALAVVRDEGVRLSRIVSELFLLARADAGQQSLQIGELYLDDLVGDCLHTLRSLAAGRTVGLRSTCAPDTVGHGDDAGALTMHHRYHGDEELLRRMLVNLVENAIKHAPASSDVSVHLESDGATHCISVSDAGAGIAEQDRDRVFERFYRADPGHGREAGSEAGGAGLGLAIARWVAEMHGGSLVLRRSNPGDTVFELRLPRRVAITPAGELTPA